MGKKSCVEEKERCIDCADREVDLEREKFHLDDYGIFQASEDGGTKGYVRLFLTAGDLNALLNLPSQPAVLPAKSRCMRRA